MSPIDDLRFLDSAADIRTTENRLPHWEQDGRTYFVTFRTGDSIPAELARAFQGELDIWLGAHPKPWSEKIAREYWERFGSRLEKWLDEGHGACVLRNAEIARIVGSALQFHEGKRCAQSAWVVMPNHIHTLFSLTESEELSRLLHSWKSFTASEINRRTGQSGTFWQKDYFDRLIRNAKHFWACARYIRKNPAKLRPGTFLHWEAEWVTKALDE